MAGSNKDIINQASAFIESGRLPEAESLLLRALAKSSADPNLNSLMGLVASLMGKQERVLYYAQKARQVAPDHPGLLCNHAGALSKLGRFEEAIALLRGAIARMDLPADGYITLSKALLMTARYEEALEAAREGEAKHPRVLGIMGNAAMATQQLGRADEALAMWHKATELDPNSHIAAEGAIACALYAEHADANQIRADLLRFDRTLHAVFGQHPAKWTVKPDPERQLRVGLLSGDLRRHAMPFFIEPILRGYDRSRWHVICYSTCTTEDDRTAQLKAYPDGWRVAGTMTDRPLAEQIRKDRIDVLLDLCGHTAGNRPGTLHERPAPVQASLIVFPGSLGMSSVPWRITDSITDPPTQPWLGPERLVNIDPCFFAYEPLADVPALSPPPSESAGVITFGSFSALQKWTDATVRLYAGVLRAVPNSRLLVRNWATKSEAVRKRITDRFVAAGISPDRLIIENPFPGAREAMADYASMDIALDTFPYHGMTTTCESLWMGVPMVVLAGKTSAARVGCSLLRAVGVPEMIAATPEEYVAIAARLAGDNAQLKRWRSSGPEGLRARMAASPLCDGAAYCRRLEGAVDFMWREFCAAATSK